MGERKILIVSPRAFGYIDYMVNALKQYDEVEVSVLFLEYAGYRNKKEKVVNFLSKTFTGVNLKKTYYFLKSDIKKIGKQDEVLIIRPDFLSDNFLKLIKKNTKVFNAFYFDSAQRVSRKQDIIHYFDTVYSFDKIDVAKYNFKFITNYIFARSEVNQNPEYLFFNISGNDDDYRFTQLENLGKYIKSKGWSLKFLSFHPKKEKAGRGIIDVIDEIIYVDEAIDLIKKSKILVELQRNNQIGLSFRIFESLGLKKKLITSNTDVVNYDFYNPQNILVVDPDNVVIPDEFVTTPYVEVPEDILEKYTIEHWVKRVFNLN
ncbi:hypothetical protein [Olleya aquimaris]|uniref:Lipopolysaccharide biosynthesis protein n=1 Tax=Olleya aquimaris TaxID=639310 RepID=A0A327R8D7_9FLAO|nr:hypothetical protein [Olleya aquimaris]RAJ13166.1 hypothetical protein LY08_02065 [Olleya aquimaris]